MTKKVAVNKQNIIVCLVLLCVAGLIYWAYATRPHVEQNDSSGSKTMVYHNNTLKEEVDGKLIWECYAETMTIDQDSKMVTMENIKGTFYRDDGSSIELTAPKGTYDQEKKHIEFEENIHAESTDGMTFDTKKITWDGEQGILTCDGEVKIAKPGMSATADKAESTDAFQNFKLIGNAHMVKGDIEE